jgi:hypothetical protein
MQMSIAQIINSSDRIADEYGGSDVDEAKFGKDIVDILRMKNGFYYRNRSLLFRPIRNISSPRGIFEWNEMKFWRDVYFVDGEDFVVFAEDAFGDPFFILDNRIYKMDMETGDRINFADDFAEWARIIYNDIQEVNSAFMDMWIEVNGPVLSGFRLCPKVPFVLGGDYELSNFSALPELQIANFKSKLAAQIKNLPDGAEINIEID